MSVETVECLNAKRNAHRAAKRAAMPVETVKALNAKKKHRPIIGLFVLMK